MFKVRVSPRHRVSRLLTLAVAMVAIIGSGVASATPAMAYLEPPWSEPAPVPGSVGASAAVFATSAAGADLTAWVGPGSASGNQIRARFRAPGATTWARVPVRADNMFIAQELALTAAPSGDFWLTWTRYNADIVGQVWVMRLDRRTGTWSPPTKLFTNADYQHTHPSIAVSGKGTVLIAATASPVVFEGYKYRAAIATLAPGKIWQRRYATPHESFSIGMNAAAGHNGHLAVSWIEGNDNTAARVMAATRMPAAGSNWKVRTISSVGASQRVSSVDIGKSGRVAVAYAGPYFTPNYVNVAYASISPALSWTSTTFATPGAAILDAAAFVQPNDSIIAVWDRSGPNRTLQATQLSGFTFTPTYTVTRLDRSSAMIGAAKRLDGSIAVLFAEHNGTAFAGLRYLDLNPDATVATTSSLPTTAAAWNAGTTFALSAVGLGAVLEIFDDAGGLALRVMDEFSNYPPRVMVSATNATALTEATIKGKAKVGNTVRCASGFWVEATTRSYRWKRDGNTIRGAKSGAYTLQTADRGHQLSCRSIGVNTVGATALLSPARSIG